MKKFAHIFSFIIIFIILVGCNTKENSHASILMINSEEYIGQEFVLKSDYTNMEYIGMVEGPLDKKNIYNESILANELIVGAKIYRIDSSTLLGNFDEENYRLFKLKN